LWTERTVPRTLYPAARKASTTCVPMKPKFENDSMASQTQNFMECQTISPGYEHKGAFWDDLVWGRHNGAGYRKIGCSSIVGDYVSS
jgi:hypothetical protein